MVPGDPQEAQFATGSSLGGRSLDWAGASNGGIRNIVREGLGEYKKHDPVRDEIAHVRGGLDRAAKGPRPQG